MGTFPKKNLNWNEAYVDFDSTWFDKFVSGTDWRLVKLNGFLSVNLILVSAFGVDI